MESKFQAGEEVVHKIDRNSPMAVIRYTNEGRVLCRRKGKSGLETVEFLEAELEKWLPPSPEAGLPFIVQQKPPPF
jgi:uncharacterized protein YodC (DUF2158 family)